MAWRSLIELIFETSLQRLRECIEKSDVETCTATLVSAADALYSPLKPIDTGFGEAKRLASQLATLVADAFIHLAASEKGDEFVAAVYSGVAEAKRVETPAPFTEAILVEAAKGVTPSWAPEPREAVYNTLKEYVEPEQPQLPRRRRREPKRLDPLRDARRVLREIGRRDPILARSLQDVLRRIGVKV